MNYPTANIVLISLLVFIINSCSSNTEVVLTEEFSEKDRNNSLVYQFEGKPQPMYLYGNRSYYLGQVETKESKTQRLVSDKMISYSVLKTRNTSDSTNTSTLPKDSVKQGKKLVKNGFLRNGNLIPSINNWRAKMLNKMLASTPFVVSPKPKVEWLGIAGYIIAILSFFTLYGIFLSIISIILGAFSIVRITQNPRRFKGKGVAIGALMIGIFSLAFWIFVWKTFSLW